EGRRVKAVLAGVSNTILTADRLDTPVSYEAFRQVGSWLGSASFIVFDDEADMVAVAAGASRFLAIESCGQCEPCKLDGLQLADRLATLGRNDGTQADLAVIRKRIGTVGDRARCSLAGQQQAVVGSILDAFAPEFDAHVLHLADATEPVLITELREIDSEGVARWDPGFLDKKPDWTYGGEGSGKVPPALRAATRRPDCRPDPPAAEAREPAGDPRRWSGAARTLTTGWWRTSPIGVISVGHRRRS